MNNIEILKLYTTRQSIKKSILKNFNITLNPKDKIRRGVVLEIVLCETGLTPNNNKKKMITEILISLGVKPGIYEGRKDFRGLTSIVVK